MTVDEMTDSLQFFKKLFDELMTLIVQETNHLAEQSIQGKHLRPHSCSKYWKPTMSNEMCIFFAVVMLLGIGKKLEIVSYW